MCVECLRARERMQHLTLNLLVFVRGSGGSFHLGYINENAPSVNRTDRTFLLGKAVGLPVCKCDHYPVVTPNATQCTDCERGRTTKHNFVELPVQKITDWIRSLSWISGSQRPENVDENKQNRTENVSQ